MSKQKVELICERCAKEFKILVRNYEKYVHDNDPIYCDNCFDEIMTELNKTELPKRKQFEYLVGDFDVDFKDAGLNGWELVQIIENKAYFKREYIEGAN